MPEENAIYRRLQEHLDHQAVGFPATRSGADLQLLQRLFSVEEAQLALHLSFKPLPLTQIVESAAGRFTTVQAEPLLESLLQKGAIGWKARNGVGHWQLLPLVIGIYEAQDGQPSPEMLADLDAYMKSREYRLSFFAVRPSQMRTIPVHKSIELDHPVASYDQIRSILEKARGPFVALKCICREGMSMRGKPCQQTQQQETCLGFNDMGAMVLRRHHGREVSREEALAILEQNAVDGLVLQPSNAQEPEFVCSCCGCCCGMLNFQKRLPRPVDFWTSSYFAEVSPEACARCGQCVTRCQVNAIRLPEHGPATVDLARCIGCGLCVTTCSPGAIRLQKKAEETVPPKDEETLNEMIQANRQTRENKPTK